MAIEMARRRFTVDEYLRMPGAGILTEDDLVELIDGVVVEMSPIGDRHVEAVNRCAEAFAALVVARRARLSTQNPVRLDGYNDPQPDVALVRPGVIGAPRSGDVLLVIEVAESSLTYDRRTKLPLYARAGIEEAWLLDLEGDALEVHREPGPDGYALVRRCRRGVRMARVVLPDVEVAVDDLLPPGGMRSEA